MLSKHTNIYLVYSDLIKLIKNAEWHNITLKICETECRSTSFSVNIESLSEFRKKGICGGITYYYGLQLFYQIATQDNKEKMHAIDTLSKLGLWLELQPIQVNDIMYQLHEYPEHISKIEIKSSPKLIRKNNNGLDVFMIDGEIRS